MNITTNSLIHTAPTPSIMFNQTEDTIVKLVVLTITLIVIGLSIWVYKEVKKAIKEGKEKDRLKKEKEGTTQAS